MNSDSSSELVQGAFTVREVQFVLVNSSGEKHVFTAQVQFGVQTTGV